MIRPDLSSKENKHVPEFLGFSPIVSTKSNLGLSRSNTKLSAKLNLVLVKVHLDLIMNRLYLNLC